MESIQQNYVNDDVAEMIYRYTKSKKQQQVSWVGIKKYHFGLFWAIFSINYLQKSYFGP